MFTLEVPIARGAALAGFMSTAFLGCTVPTLPSDLPNPNPELGKHLIRFVHLSDPQLVDEESPARSLRMEGLLSASWRAQEAYGVATLDATIREVNRIHAAGKEAGAPVDFAIVTGDLCDLAGTNELRWFIDTMDGKVIETDSGDTDGATRTENSEENPKLPYQAEGLNPEIPWYTVVGNHDVLAVGNFAINTAASDKRFHYAPVLGPVAGLMGLHDISPNLNGMFSAFESSPAVVTGLGPELLPNSFFLALNVLQAGDIVADEKRVFLTLHDFMEEHFDSTTQPPGHGFTQENLDTGKALYSFRPVPEIPLRVIVLDTVPPDAPRAFPAFYGVMTEDQFENYLKPELASALEAGEQVILASHHASGDFSFPFPTRKVNTNEFRRYVSSQPHVLAHLCGHTHFNAVFEVHGEHSYYEIMTGAVIDYPQEARMIDIYFDDAENSYVLASTMISHMNNPTLLSAESHRRASAELLTLDAPIGKAVAEGIYQTIFAEFRPLLGLDKSGRVPREQIPHALDRRGRPEDRDVILRVAR